MQERARGQGIVPGERRQPTDAPVVVDQLEKLLGELLRFASYRRWPVGCCQTSVLCRDKGRLVTVRNAV